MHLNLMTDVFTSVALLLGMAHIFGMLSRHMLNPATQQILLGFCFGLVSFLQLQNPFEAMPGVIIDLRNVPVLLAGAFLGWRGALITVLIAACTRFSIGGAGMVSGLVSIGLAGGFGLAWSVYVQRVASLRWYHIAQLAGLGMCTMIGALLLDAPIALWFYTHAAPMLVVAYAVSVPLGAFALAAQRKQLGVEATLRSSARYDPDTGFLTWTPFYRDICAGNAVRENNPTRQLLLIKVKTGTWITETWGASKLTLLLQGVRSNLQDHPLFAERRYAITPDRRIAVQVLERDLVHIDKLIDDLTRLFESTTISPDGHSLERASIRVSRIDYSDDLPVSEQGFFQMLEQSARSVSGVDTDGHVLHVRTDAALFENAGREAALSDKLFSKMDCLVGAQRKVTS